MSHHSTFRSTVPIEGVRICAALVMLVMASWGARETLAQDQWPVVVGNTSAEAGTLLLPGVSIAVRDLAGQVVATVLSDGMGRFELFALAPGRYQLTARLDGFATLEQPIVVQLGSVPELDLQFELAQRSETVEVIAPVSVQFTDITVPVASREVFDTDFIEESPTSDDSIESALPLLPGIIQGPDGINIKGGRPTQSSLQLGSGGVVDPSTGNADFTLPASAVESVVVLPNPYSVEYGRFTSGVTVIEPKRGGDAWSVAVNNPFPAFHTKRGAPLEVIGIRGFSPSFTVGGPLVPGRLFLAQSGQYRFSSTDVRSRPETERRTQESFNSFTRLDAPLPGGHHLGVTVGIFPEELSGVGLDTFTPPEATPDISRETYHVAVSDTAALSNLALLETTLQVNHHGERVGGRTVGSLELSPEQNRGNFYNTQDRGSTTYQWLGSWTGFHQGAAGDNLFKIGADLLHVRFDGQSQSAPVSLRRVDGTLAQQIVFSESRRHTLNSTDLALYAQDRWQFTDRLLLEFGVRLDRDGVLGRSHLSPRFGVALNLDDDGTKALRGGIGSFYERTPSTVGVFERFEQQIVTDFAGDGITPLGPPIRFVPVAADDLDTARGRTWHVEYRHQITPTLSIAVEHLRRRGTDELIVERRAGIADAQLLLSSQGRSRYRETGFGVQYSRGAGLDLDVTYVNSAAAADLNAFSAFFNSVRAPLIRANEFAPTGADAPHRLLARVRMIVAEKWRFVPVLEMRSGFPYSAVDERYEFVGSRNRDRRFPTVARFDIAAERRFSLGKWEPWLGVRIRNLFNRFEPRDVQHSLASPSFGQFFNSEPLRVRVTVRVRL